MSINDLPAVAMTLILVATIFVSGYLVFAGLGSSPLIADGDGDGNASTLSTGEVAINDITGGFDSIISYAPTWGVIIGVSVLLSIVVGSFMFARNKGYM